MIPSYLVAAQQVGSKENSKTLGNRCVLRGLSVYDFAAGKCRDDMDSVGRIVYHTNEVEQETPHQAKGSLPPLPGSSRAELS